MKTQPDTQLHLQAALRASLWNDLLSPWFPRCVDPEGGFYQEFAEDWSRGPHSARSLVFQARMTWLCATVSMLGHPRSDEFAHYARGGVRWLAERLHEPQAGAFLWTTDADSPHFGQKHAYGQAFAIYGLAAAARALNSSEALRLAQDAFRWVRDSLWDPVHGGYFELPRSQSTPDTKDAIGTPYGQKSQNTHLHLLEAFAELHRAWPDPTVASCLHELIDLFLGPLYVSEGWLHQFVWEDWQPVPGPLSFGHDVEATHLILDAAAQVGRQDDEPLIAKARALTDFALRHGWDAEGGFYYTGTPDGAIVDRIKSWWVQAEGLLALATLYRLTGESTYFDHLQQQWRWIDARQIDHEHGGWYATVLDGRPRPEGKGHSWKAAYHDGRAMIFALRELC